MGRWVVVGSRRVPNPIPVGRNPISWYRWKLVPVARYEYDQSEINADETKLAADEYSKTVAGWEETLPVGNGSWAEALRVGRELRLLAERNFSLYQTPWRTTDLLEVLIRHKARAKAPEETPPADMPYTLGPWSFAGYRCIYTMNYPGSKAIKPAYRYTNGKQETNWRPYNGQEQIPKGFGDFELRTEVREATQVEQDRRGGTLSFHGVEIKGLKGLDELGGRDYIFNNAPDNTDNTDRIGWGNFNGCRNLVDGKWRFDK